MSTEIKQSFQEALSKVALPKAGVLLVDKPTGMTSHDVVAVVRWLTKVKRVGHAGTLDPLASGLLIVLIGREFTKLQSDFLHQDKMYQVQAELGTTTDTYDADGKILAQRPWSDVRAITQTQLLTGMQKFVGPLSQQVPAYSAVKVGGQKLYDLARSGQAEQVILPIKSVTVHDWTLDSFEIDDENQRVTFTSTVKCSSGTYIRSLIHDLGQALAVGAYVTKLRRTQIGQLKVPDDVALVLELPHT